MPDTPGPEPEPASLPTSLDALQALAMQILQGMAATPAQMLRYAKALKAKRDFTTARRLLARARTLLSHEPPALRLELLQQHALCTSKDPNLPVDQRLNRALEILQKDGDLDGTTNQETLGIAGGIHKRRFEIDGRRQHLELSLYLYERGYAQGFKGDNGYTGINAAFVLDLLANDEEAEATKAGMNSPNAQRRHDRARDIRSTLADGLQKLAADPGHAWLKGQYWFLVTVAEALFGLDDYVQAGEWLIDARALPDVANWEYETTARQLLRLAQLRRTPVEDGVNSPAAALRRFLQNDNAAVQSLFVGKVGLALSGGGFRASLFHIGVLARLAELDVLRHIEVLSCVSGGSIIGAHYYLELRHLLQRKSDDDLEQQDYIDIVKRLETNFLVGVQKNLRTRVVANPWTSLKMAFLPGYSRTVRLGELYESKIYSSVADGETGPRLLNKLFIKPEGGPANFQPKVDNWRRKFKAPILILNATTLNTGHNWQFTASWMGEPPTSIDSEVDGADRLRRMYYHQAPPEYQNVRLGQAVAASSCVPGLFEPIALAGLYPKRIVRLVDGGVYDNQGVAGLLGEDCTVLLVSDASGQIASQDKPAAGALSVPLRANDILMARVRGAQYRDMDGRVRSSLLRGLMFLHLKKDLDVVPVDWDKCPDPYLASEDYEQTRPVDRRGPMTRYGVLKSIQEKLAGIRTDLDSFSDAEAYALMMSGYRMADHEFPLKITGFPPSGVRASWRFREVEEILQPAAGRFKAHQRLVRILEIGSKLALKVWFLEPCLLILGILILLALAGGLVWEALHWWNTPVLSGITVGIVFKSLLGLVAVGLVPASVTAFIRVIRYKETIHHAVLKTAIIVLGMLVAWLHLLVFDKAFLRFGDMKPGSPLRKGD